MPSKANMNDVLVNATRDDLLQILDWRENDIIYLMQVIRQIYACCGEDKLVASLCNDVLDSGRFSGW